MPGHAAIVAARMASPAAAADPAPLSVRAETNLHAMAAQTTAVTVTVTAPTPLANPSPIAAVAPSTLMPIGDLLDFVIRFRRLRRD